MRPLTTFHNVDARVMFTLRITLCAGELALSDYFDIDGLANTPFTDRCVYASWNYCLRGRTRPTDYNRIGLLSQTSRGRTTSDFFGITISWITVCTDGDPAGSIWNPITFTVPHSVDYLRERTIRPVNKYFTV